MIGRVSPPDPKPTAAGSEREEEASPGAFEDLPPLPRAGDPYKAWARIDNKPVPTLHCLLADGQVRGFSLGNLDSIDLLGDDAGQGLVIVLRFDGIVAVEVRLSGRKLGTLHTYLGFHRVAWVRELPKGKLAVELMRR